MGQATKGESRSNNSSKLKDADHVESADRINPQSTTKKKRSKKPAMMTDEFNELGESKLGEKKTKRDKREKREKKKRIAQNDEENGEPERSKTREKKTTKRLKDAGADAQSALGDGSIQNLNFRPKKTDKKKKQPKPNSDIDLIEFNKTGAEDALAVTVKKSKTKKKQRSDEIQDKQQQQSDDRVEEFKSPQENELFVESEKTIVK